MPQIKIKAGFLRGNDIKGKADAEKKYVKISFFDNGLGLDCKYAKKIFQVFQRLHGNNQFEGTGIGLAICKKVMDNHNSFITVESKEEEGSVFNCYFPLE